MLGDPGVVWPKWGWGARRPWGAWRSPLSRGAHSSSLARAPWGALRTCNGTRGFGGYARGREAQGGCKGEGGGSQGQRVRDGSRGHRPDSLAAYEGDEHSPPLGLQDSGHLVHNRCLADADFQNVLSSLF